MARIKVLVKPKSAASYIVFNKDKNTYIAYVTSAREDNKANIELIKLVYRKFKKRAKIVKGLRSKEKLLDLEA